MNQQINKQDNLSSHDKNVGKNGNKDLSELANDAKKIFLNNSDESVFKNLLNMQECQQLDKVFEQIENFVYKYAESVTTNQLRNVYNEIVKIQTIRDLKLIRPNLAYIAARQDNKKAKEFMAFIDLLIQKVNTEKELQSFKKTMEAIVSYHKFYAKN